MMQETTFLNHVKANEQKLFRYALRMLKDVAKAEDALNGAHLSVSGNACLKIVLYSSNI